MGSRPLSVRPDQTSRPLVPARKTNLSKVAHHDPSVDQIGFPFGLGVVIAKVHSAERASIRMSVCHFLAEFGSSREGRSRGPVLGPHTDQR